MTSRGISFEQTKSVRKFNVCKTHKFAYTFVSNIKFK